MKKTFWKFWVIILSCFMVLSNASLPSYSEDISDNENNDIANLNCKMKLELRNWDKGACPFIPIRAAAGPLFSFFI